VLVVGLVGRRSTTQEDHGVLVRLRVYFGDLVGVVVLHFVVVPGDDPREGRVCRLEILVRLVERVAVAVFGEREDLWAVMGADVTALGDVLVRAVLVDVVAEVHDEVKVLLTHPPVRRVVAVLVHLAGGEREGERLDACPRHRSGLGPSCGTQLRPRPETVEVLAGGLEAPNLDVERVGKFGPGEPFRASHHLPEALIFGDLPVHRHLQRRHPAVAVLRQRIGSQPRPQDHPAGQGIP
jgi:hypothetical protein